eukprot:4186794-Amphidinium_carterae.1
MLSKLCGISSSNRSGMHPCRSDGDVDLIRQSLQLRAHGLLCRSGVAHAIGAGTASGLAHFEPTQVH